MAAISNATTTTSIVEIVKSEEIQRFILETHEEPDLIDALGYLIDASGAMSATWTVPLESKLTLNQSEASPHTQTDEIPVSEWLLTEVQITAKTVGIREVVPDEAKQDAIVDFVQRIIMQNRTRLRLQACSDMLSNITDATNTELFSGLPLTTTRLGTAIAQYRSQLPTGGPGAIVLSYVQVDDLVSDMRSSAASIYAGAAGDRALDGMMNAQRMGLVMENYEGLAVYQTGQLPAYDGSNTSGAIMSTGIGGALGMAVWKGVTHEGWREGPRLSDHLISSVRYGTNLIEDTNIVEVASANS